MQKNSILSWAKFSTVACMIVVAAISRVLPHPPNFAPMTALALFAGAYLSSLINQKAISRIISLLLPLIAMLISDSLLELITGWGFHKGMPVIYGTISVITMIGWWLQSRRTIGTIALATFGGSVIFFIVTNFFVWFGGKLYPQTIEGLAACYVAALPFFGNSLMGDIVYSTLLFGGFAFAERTVFAKQVA